MRLRKTPMGRERHRPCGLGRVEARGWWSEEAGQMDPLGRRAERDAWESAVVHAVTKDPTNRNWDLAQPKEKVLQIFLKR